MAVKGLNLATDFSSDYVYSKEWNGNIGVHRTTKTIMFYASNFYLYLHANWDQWIGYQWMHFTLYYWTGSGWRSVVSANELADKDSCGFHINENDKKIDYWNSGTGGLSVNAGAMPATYAPCIWRLRLNQPNEYFAGSHVNSLRVHLHIGGLGKLRSSSRSNYIGTSPVHIDGSVSQVFHGEVSGNPYEKCPWMRPLVGNCINETPEENIQIVNMEPIS